MQGQSDDPTAGHTLNWTKGVLLQPQGDDTFVSPCLPVGVGCNTFVKALIDDSQWQLGANSVVSDSKGWVVFPFFFSTAGRYEYVRSVPSRALGNTRDIVVYVPPSFDENPYKLYDHLLVMHDGENLFNASTAFSGVAWRVQDSVDSLVREGRIPEVVVVGVDNTARRIFEYTYVPDPKYGPDGGGADVYLDFIESTVIPLVKSKFRLADSSDVGTVGSSLGGLLSCYAGWTRPQVYSRVGCMSPSVWWNSQDFNRTILKRPFLGTPGRLYLDSGDADGDAGQIEPDTKQCVATIQMLPQWLPGQNLFYYLAKGAGHNEKDWGGRFRIPMEALYEPNPSVTAEWPV